MGKLPNQLMTCRSINPWPGAQAAVQRPAVAAAALRQEAEARLVQHRREWAALLWAAVYDLRALG